MNNRRANYRRETRACINIEENSTSVGTGSGKKEKKEKKKRRSGGYCVIRHIDLPCTGCELHWRRLRGVSCLRAMLPVHPKIYFETNRIGQCFVPGLDRLVLYLESYHTFFCCFVCGSFILELRCLTLVRRTALVQYGAQAMQ